VSSVILGLSWIADHYLTLFATWIAIDGTDASVIWSESSGPPHPSIHTSVISHETLLLFCPPLDIIFPATSWDGRMWKYRATWPLVTRRPAAHALSTYGHQLSLISELHIGRACAVDQMSPSCNWRIIDYFGWYHWKRGWKLQQKLTLNLHRTCWDNNIRARSSSESFRTTWIDRFTVIIGILFVT